MILKLRKIKFIIIFFSILFNLIIIKLLIYKSNKIRICLCAIVKLENNYIIEFIEHYKKYRLDKIFIYDNNDIDGESLNILNSYIKSGFIEIINYRGKPNPQLNAYTECYYKNNKNYHWFLFYDIDEYLNLREYTDIHGFLSQKKFDKCQSIYLNFNHHTDNDLTFYENRTLHQRFPRVYQNKNYCIGKSIIKRGIKNLNIHSAHVIDRNITKCNGFGKIIKIKRIFCKNPDYKYHYIDHYQFKSTEEYIRKMNKGDVRFKNTKKVKYRKVWDYFRVNKVTLFKIKYISQLSGLNESYIKEELIQNANDYRWLIA